MRALTAVAGIALALLAAPGASADSVERGYEPPSVIIAGNPAGDAIVTYEPARFDPGVLLPRVALRPRGGRFGPRIVLTEDTVVAAGIDDQGAGTLLALDNRGDRDAVVARPVGAATGLSGEPVTLAEGGLGAFQNLRLAVGPAGDVAACWYRAEAPECVYRPAGGTFGPAHRFPGYTGVDGIVIDTSGTARLVLATNVARTLVTRPRSGPWGDPARGADLGAGGDLLGVAGNRSGDVAVATRVYAPDGARLATLRGRGGPVTFSPLAPLSPGPISGGSPPAVVLPDDPARARVAAYRPDNERPLVARPFASGASLPGAELARRFAAAGDPAGRYAIAYGEVAAPLRLALAPPGGSLGRSLVLDPATFAGAVALLPEPDGGVTAVWQRSDLRTVELVERRVAAGGAMAATSVLFSLRAAGRPTLRRCPRARAVLRNRDAVVVRAPRGPVRRICSLQTRRAEYVGLPDLPPLDVALGGPTFAVIEQGFWEEVDGGRILASRLRVRDARTGAPLPGVDPRGVLDELPERATVEVVVTPAGGVAWAQCATRSRIREAERGRVRAACGRPGARVSVVKLDAGDHEPVVLTEGRDVDPFSLRRRAGRVSWSEGGRRRAAPLR